MKVHFLRILSQFIIFSLTFSSYSYSQDSKPVNLEDYLKPETYLAKELDDFNDSAYFYAEPQYAEKPDPKKKIAYEVFMNDLTESSTEEKNNQIKWVKNEFKEERLENANIPIEILVLGPNGSRIEQDEEVREIVEAIKIENTDVVYEDIPEYSSYTVLDKTGSYQNQIKASDRKPSSFFNSNIFLTFIRTTLNTGGAALGLIIGKGISPKLGMVVATNAGLMSGGLQYYNAKVGQWLTSGKSSKWLIESNNWFTQKMRNAFKLTPNVLAKLTKVEELVKWAVTEIVYTSVITANMALNGLTGSASFLSLTGDVLSSSGLGIIAQGPADIAVQKRKYQKIEELKNEILNGKIEVENKAKLLEEIESILKKESVISKNSHALLQKIQSWANKRAVLLSVLQVSGVVMNVAGVPGSAAMLVGMGIGGGIYYGKVHKWTWKGTKNLILKKINDAVTYFGRICKRSFGRKG
jgi:hypothetical protein